MREIRDASNLFLLVVVLFTCLKCCNETHTSSIRGGGGGLANEKGGDACVAQDFLAPKREHS